MKSTLSKKSTHITVYSPTEKNNKNHESFKDREYGKQEHDDRVENIYSSLQQSLESNFGHIKQMMLEMNNEMAKLKLKNKVTDI